MFCVSQRTCKNKDNISNEYDDKTIINNTLIQINNT